jgi:hypothetical protein
LNTVQIVGGIAASAKNALDLAKASSDHALKAAVPIPLRGHEDIDAHKEK